MLLNNLYKDSDFLNSQVPEGYLLVFYSLDESGNIIRRYKNSNGEFGNIGNADIPEEVAKEQITQAVNNVEEIKEEISIQLVEATTISYQIDKIIGE